MPEKTEIAQLIPHAGDMMLIDSVDAYDDHHIRCRARVTDTAAHPLSRDGVLPATALAEYGAQAMAVHGGLLAPEGQATRRGLLAGLNRLVLSCDHLDQPGELDISAQCELNSAGGMIYGFQVASAGKVLAQGQATVMFPDPETG